MEIKKANVQEEADDFLDEFYSRAEWIVDWCLKLTSGKINISKRSLVIKKQFIETRYEQIKNMFEILGGSESSRKVWWQMYDVDEAYFSAIEFFEESMEEPLKHIAGNVTEKPEEDKTEAVLEPVVESTESQEATKLKHTETKKSVNSYVDQTEKVPEVSETVKGESHMRTEEIKSVENVTQKSANPKKEAHASVMQEAKEPAPEPMEVNSSSKSNEDDVADVVNEEVQSFASVTDDNNEVLAAQSKQFSQRTVIPNVTLASTSANVLINSKTNHPWIDGNKLATVPSNYEGITTTSNSNNYNQHKQQWPNTDERTKVENLRPSGRPKRDPDRLKCVFSCLVPIIVSALGRMFKFI